MSISNRHGGSAAALGPALALAAAVPRRGPWRTAGPTSSISPNQPTTEATGGSQ